MSRRVLHLVRARAASPPAEFVGSDDRVLRLADFASDQVATDEAADLVLDAILAAELVITW
ncbi:MAG: hypothetical protein EXR73_05790 [Myxococcales bacterium]|nr:hypothetical protein [Myxococcales bacterium]